MNLEKFDTSLLTRREFLKLGVLASADVTIGAADYYFSSRKMRLFRGGIFSWLERAELKPMPPRVLTIDFAPHDDLDGLIEAQSPMSDSQSEMEILGDDYQSLSSLFIKYGPFLLDGGISSEMLKKSPKQTVIKAIGNHYKDHGEKVAAVLIEAWRQLGVKSDVYMMPLQNEDFIESISLSKDKDCQHQDVSAFISSEIIIKLIKSALDQEKRLKIVNLSLQLGHAAVSVNLKDLNQYDMLEPYRPEKVEESISELRTVCKFFPDMLFVIAAGNSYSDLREVMNRRDWPKNVIPTAAFNPISRRPNADVFGSKIIYIPYPYGSGLLPFPYSSFTTPLISGIAAYLYDHHGFTLEQVKSAVYSLSFPEDYYARDGKKEVARVFRTMESIASVKIVNGY